MAEEMNAGNEDEEFQDFCEESESLTHVLKKVCAGEKSIVVIDSISNVVGDVMTQFPVEEIEQNLHAFLDAVVGYINRRLALAEPEAA